MVWGKGRERGEVEGGHSHVLEAREGGLVGSGEEAAEEVDFGGFGLVGQVGHW